MNIFVGDLQNDKDLELYGYSDNTEQYDENGLPLDGTTGYLNSTDNQLTGNLGDDNGYIYGELNRKVEHQTFTGKETETASTYVNNQSDTIEVNVKKTPKKLTIIDGSLVKTFDGSEDINIEISSVEGYATKADLEAEAALREQTDKDITSKLNTEISNRESADNALSEALKTETEERILKDNQLQENITNLDTSIPEKVNQILQQGHYVSDENYVHTDNNFTDDDKTELDTLHQMRINDEFGKVDGVTVNDVEQPIENKIVKLTIDKSTVGLDKVDNTSDKDKPVSDAVQLELDSINTNLSSTQTDLSSFKEETNRNISDINSTITSEVTRINQELQTTTNNINTLDGKVDGHINNQNNPHNITKEQIGLGNVDNTSDLNKPISTQTQTALDGLNQTITNNFNNLNSSIENETERATLAETEISTKLQQEMNTRVQEHAEIQGKIDTINSKIPNQASSTNQLADKAFVNSTINSSAAFFKGSFKSKAALDAVQWQTTDSSLATYVSNNDYAYVEADETHNNEAWRYIYVKDNTVSEWQPQFRVNESPFTQAQLDAINSGATTDLINSINSKLTQNDIVDETGDSSTKAISQRAATLGINAVQNNLNTHILDKNNPHQVTKAQIGLGNVDNTSDLDKPVSTAVRAALNDYLLIANIDNSLNSTSANPVQNKVLYSPVTFAESERQKSKNLLEVNNGLDKTNLGLHVQINNNIITVDGTLTHTAAIEVTAFNPKIYAGKTYTLSFKDYSNVNGFDITVTGTRNDGTQRFNMLNLTPVITSTTITADVDYELKIEIYASANDTASGTFKLQLEENSVATDYQPYNGQITHNGDPAVEFAESERQKSKNLFPNETVSGNSTALKYFNTLPAGTYTLSSIVSSASPDTHCFVEVYYNDTYIGFYTLTKSTIRTSETITINSSFNKLTFYSGVSNYNNYDFTFNQVQLEEGSVATEYQPYNGQITHNGDAPVVFAESERQKSKNLFNKDAVLKNHEINGNTGEIVNSTDYWVSDYIRVVGMNYVYISSTKTTGSSNVFYDNNYNILSISQKTNGALSIPSNAVYMRCNGLLSELENDIQIEEGSVATDYQPYNGQITHNGDAPVVFAEREKNRAINLFNYKTQAGTSDVTNNQDGSFTISNLTFYYPSLLLNIALKPNTKYTFAETVLEVSDSVGLEESNVAFGVVAYYTDGTYSTTPEIPIRGTGRYSGTFTTNSKTIDYVEYRILRKNNSTSILNGKITDISVCEGDNTVYYPYEGLIVHEEQLSNYLPLSGGTLTGQLKLASDGLITNANDGYSTDKWGNLNALSSDAGALFKINSYDKSKSLTYAWNTGVLNLPAKPLINNQDVLALKSDIISSDNFVTIDTAQTITGKKTFNDLISINKNGIRVDIGAENTFGAHLYASAGDFFAFNKKLIPNTTNSLGLGDTSNKWSSLYTNTSVNIGSCTQTYNASTKSLVYSFE